MKLLNLGCGQNIITGWINVDLRENPGVDLIFDLNAMPERCLPFEDSSIDVILLSHVLERLDRPLDVMEEFWRIATPNALLIIRVPHGGSDEAWIDLTHRRPFFPRSFSYFGQPKYHNFDYGYSGDWRCDTILLATPLLSDNSLDKKTILAAIHRQRNLCSEMVALLYAVKPRRPRQRELMSAPELNVVSDVPNDPNFFLRENFMKIG